MTCKKCEERIKRGKALDKKTDFLYDIFHLIVFFVLLIIGFIFIKSLILIKIEFGLLAFIIFILGLMLYFVIEKHLINITNVLERRIKNETKN